MKLNEDLAELTGTIIGDGCLYGNKGKYLIMIAGHQFNDKEYYDIISNRVYKLINYRCRLRVSSRALRILIQNKELYNFFVKGLGMKYEGKKTYCVYIPNEILSNKKYTKLCLRGIVDTDGSVFTSNKKGSPNYPAIEITTVSKKLALQIFHILSDNNYRIKLKKRKRTDINVPIYKLSLYGWDMLNKWYHDIGFTNPYKKNRAEKILNEKFGGNGVI